MPKLAQRNQKDLDTNRADWWEEEVEAHEKALELIYNEIRPINDSQFGRVYSPDTSGSNQRNAGTLFRTGRVIPRQRHYESLCKLCGVSMDYFFKKS